MKVRILIISARNDKVIYRLQKDFKNIQVPPEGTKIRLAGETLKSQLYFNLDTGNYMLVCEYVTCYTKVVLNEFLEKG